MMMARESDDRVFGNLPKIDDEALGGIWDAEPDITRPYGERANHADWHGQFFASRGSLLADFVKAPACIGDAYGDPTRDDLQIPDNVVIPGQAYNCQCSMRLVYDLEDVPTKNLTAKGRRALKEDWLGRLASRPRNPR